ncbi:twin-arginine translocation signal domain-containing protein [Limnobacter sp.]|uniref:twin-arginine translocation signal domain-containing protein n=1 Tax=Limnobacter sp. TaxID=2003368 RepID=UPI0025861DB0|nr:twin-arginine translocation signal domain-containing protein [Limnobacter sp.]HEX5486925.1 twin-arginine translocation signal domain-containing protein [Limnobacter sp.]
MTNKSKMNDKSVASRRQFLLGAGVGAAAAGAALLASQKAQTVEKVVQAEPSATPVKGDGYQLSEHVKTYYRTLLV